MGNIGHNTWTMGTTVGLLFMIIMMLIINRIWLFNIVMYILVIPFNIAMLIVMSPLIIIQMITGIGDPFPWRKMFKMDPKIDQTFEKDGKTYKKDGFEDW